MKKKVSEHLASKGLKRSITVALLAALVAAPFSYGVYAESEIHYVSIKSNNKGANSNYGNDGAEAKNSIAIGPSVETTGEDNIVIGSGELNGKKGVTSFNGYRVLAVGHGNYFQPTSDRNGQPVSYRDSAIIGHDNKLLQGNADDAGGGTPAYQIIHGWKNTLKGSFTGAIGYENEIQNSSRPNHVSQNMAFAIGSENKIDATGYYMGDKNRVNTLPDYKEPGSNPNIVGADLYVIGRHNIIGSSKGGEWYVTSGHIIGTGNVIYSDSTNVFGDNNKVYSGSGIAIGNANKVGIDNAGNPVKNKVGRAIYNPVAVGHGNIVTGNYGVALGVTAESRGEKATAVGSTAYALSDYSAALGTENRAKGYGSVAVGSLNNRYDFDNPGDKWVDFDSGKYSSAVGVQNISTGAESSAVGVKNKALGKASSSFGYLNVAAGERSSAVGYWNKAEGEKSSSFGYLNIATGKQSSALGFRNYATAENSAAIGIYNNKYNVVKRKWEDQTAGDSSVAIGAKNHSAGGYSSALGYENMSGGTASSAVGYRNITDADQAAALGYANQATAKYSSAVGALNQAEGQYSSAVGSSNQAEGKRSQAVGYRNFVSGYGAVSIGSENNLNFVKQYQALGFVQTGDLSSALGISNTTAGRKSMGIGSSNYAFGTKSAGIGMHNYSTGYETLAIGHYAVAGSEDPSKIDQVKYAAAIGNRAKSTITDAVAIGSFSNTTRDKGDYGYDPSLKRVVTDADITTDTNIGTYRTELETARTEWQTSMEKAEDLLHKIHTQQYADDAEHQQWNAEYDRLNADADAKMAAYDAAQKKVSDLVGAWQGQMAALSVGDEKTGRTRQITGVAAGSADTDAVNVAQLKALSTKMNNGTVHYYSVTSDKKAAGSNFDNDGAKAADSMVIGIGSSSEAPNSTVLGNNNTLKRYNADQNGSSSRNNIVVGQNMEVEGAHNAVFGTDYQNNLENRKTMVAGKHNTVIGVGNLAGYTAKKDPQNRFKWIYSKVENGSDSGNVVVGMNNTATRGSLVIGSESEATSSGISVGNHNKVVSDEDFGVALGSDLVVDGYGSIAVGRESKATANWGTAIGTGAVAEKENSIAFGNSAKAQNDYSVAFGSFATATAKSGVALGSSSLANREKGALGYLAEANTTSEAWKATQGAISIGNSEKKYTRQLTGLAAGTDDTDAVNVAQLKALSTKMNNGTVHYYSVTSDKKAARSNYDNDGAKANDSMVIGISSTSEGINSTVIGNNNKLTGNTSYIGDGGKAVKVNNSIVAGQNLEVDGYSNTVFATEAVYDMYQRQTKVAGDHNTVIGAGNLVGYSEEDSENGYTYTKLGQGISSNKNVVIGTRQTVSGSNNVAVGYLTEFEVGADQVTTMGIENHIGSEAREGVAIGNHLGINGYQTVAIGFQSQANAKNAMSIGQQSSADAENSVAIGVESQANAKNAMSIGQSSEADVEGGVALGLGSIANREAGMAGYLSDGKTTAEWQSTLGALSVGVVSDKWTHTRQITGVAAGTDDTDAVNVAQLKALEKKVGTAGKDGKSAYEIWRDHTVDGKQPNKDKSEQEFLDSLKGKNGKDGEKGKDGVNGTKGTDGKNGTNGKSAYDIWKEQKNDQGEQPNKDKTEKEFLDSLKGKDGKDGTGADIDIKGDTESGVSVTPNTESGKKTYTIGLGTKIKAGEVTIDGTKGKENVVVGDVKINGEKGKGTITGLSNTTWDVNKIVSGRAATEDQLKQATQNMQNHIYEVGKHMNGIAASNAALAGLHPLEYDEDDKWNLSAAIGNYKGANAFALGAFYQPNERTLLSIGGTLAGEEHLLNVGLSLKTGPGTAGKVYVSRAAMAREIQALKWQNKQREEESQKLLQDNRAIREENKEMKKELEWLKAQVAQLMAK